MGKWKKGDRRRFEWAWSPRDECIGYYTLNTFSQVKTPVVLRDLLDKEKALITIVECDGKKEGLGQYDYFVFHVVGRYNYENLPDCYKDRRGEYLAENNQKATEPAHFDDWPADRSSWYIRGYPYLRPGAPEALALDLYRREHGHDAPRSVPVPEWLLPPHF